MLRPALTLSGSFADSCRNVRRGPLAGTPPLMAARRDCDCYMQWTSIPLAAICRPTSQLEDRVPDSVTPLEERSLADRLTEITEVENAVLRARNNLRYFVNDYTVEVLFEKYRADSEGSGIGDLFIPSYQRAFVWDRRRQSYFIESLLLAVPISPIFFYDVEGRLEVVDGSQRLRTIFSFIEGELKLNDLENLSILNGFSIGGLPAATRRRFMNTTIRSFLIAETTSPASRFDLFRRINTGSLKLQPAELRRGMLPGSLMDLVKAVAATDEFKALTPMGIGRARDADAEREELVVRFFAYANEYSLFVHDVEGFINDFVERANSWPPERIDEAKRQFERMLSYVRHYFPYGFRRTPTANMTPRVQFEAISVGVHLALKAGLREDNAPDLSWLRSPEFTKHVTTHASNSGPRLRGRVEFVRDRLLNQ